VQVVGECPHKDAGGHCSLPSVWLPVGFNKAALCCHGSILFPLRWSKMEQDLVKAWCSAACQSPCLPLMSHEVHEAAAGGNA
jgi:hypothetical protein